MTDPKVCALVVLCQPVRLIWENLNSAERRSTLRNFVDLTYRFHCVLNIWRPQFLVRCPCGPRADGYSRHACRQHCARLQPPMLARAVSCTTMRTRTTITPARRTSRSLAHVRGSTRRICSARHGARGERRAAGCADDDAGGRHHRRRHAVGAAAPVWPRSGRLPRWHQHSCTVRQLSWKRDQGQAGLLLRQAPDGREVFTCSRLSRTVLAASGEPRGER